MSEDKEFLEMCALNSIENICEDFDFLCDSAVEEKMVCDFGCCILHNRSTDIFDNPSAELRALLGDEGLKLTHQLDEFFKQGIEAVDYGETEGFSKTQEWVDFVGRMSKINIFLKDILRKHGRTIN